MNDELFDVVNDRNEVIGCLPRAEVHRRGLKHRSAHLLLFNSRGDLFLQQRSFRKDTCPGAWDSSAAGHLSAGESYDDAVRRETREELGIVLGSAPEPLFTLEASPETGHEFIWVYRATHDGPFHLHPLELTGGGWFHPDHVDRWTADRPEDFARSFCRIWQKYLALPKP